MIPVKTTEQSERDILTSIVTQKPENASFEKNSAAYDIFIRPLSDQVTDLTIIIDYVSRIMSLDELERIVRDAAYQQRLREALNYTVDEMNLQIKNDIDNLVSNWNITRLPATKARGYVYFYVATSSAISFPANQSLGTVDNTVDFVTLNAFVDALPSFDASLGQYFLSCPVEAVTAGSIGNQIPGRIRSVKTSITGVTGCYNPIATLFGEDEETNIKLISRARKSWTSRRDNVFSGVIDIVLSFPGVLDASVVFFEDALMERKARGAVDVYLITSTKIQTAEVVIDSVAARYIYEVINDQTTFEVYPTSFNPSDSLVFKLPSQPVISISSVSYKTSPSGGYSTLSTNNYSLIKDTSGVFKGSVKGNDVIQITGGIIPDNSFIKVDYSYNRILKELQALVVSPIRHLPGVDILFKLGIQKTVNIVITPVIFADYNIEDVKTTIVNDLTKFFSGGIDSNNIERLAFKLGQPLDRTDIINVILDVEGVDRLINISDTRYFSISIDGIEIADQYSLAVNNYLRIGVVTFKTLPIEGVREITNVITTLD